MATFSLSSLSRRYFLPERYRQTDLQYADRGAEGTDPNSGRRQVQQDGQHHTYAAGCYGLRQQAGIRLFALLRIGPTERSRHRRIVVSLASKAPTLHPRRDYAESTSLSKATGFSTRKAGGPFCPGSLSTPVRVKRV